MNLPFENPFDLSEDVTVDILKSQFSENLDENINTAFIYLRNIDYVGMLDFSDYTYEQKELVVMKYIERDIQELSLKQLDDSIMRFFCNCQVAEAYGVSSIFTDEEIQIFISKHKSLLQDIESFMLSIPLYILSLGKEQTDASYDYSKVKHCDKKLVFYQAVLSLIGNRCFNILLLTLSLDRKYGGEKLFYDAYFSYGNQVLADLVSKTTFSKLYAEVYREV